MLDSTTLLAAWEQGAGQSPSVRAITLLTVARPRKSAEQWSLTPIGDRDRELLAIREELFGTKLEATAKCLACGERLELSFATTDIVAQSATHSQLMLEADGYTITCHVPTTADVAAATDRGSLLDRCVDLAKYGSEIVAASALPPEVTFAIESAIEKADPQAEVKFALQCPTCGSHWESVFDIVSFLWGELEDWARRLLWEVHLLASAYGWSERDILAMTPRRRSIYLEMAGVA
jgi:hypothetical protein